MKIFAVIAVLLLVALFPPVDWVLPGVPSQQIGELTTGATLESTKNAGFLFIGKLEPEQRIRMGQWLTQLAVVAAAGALVLVSSRNNARPPALAPAAGSTSAS